jgi:hypothetical protein
MASRQSPLKILILVVSVSSVCLFRWPPESTNGRAQTYSGITGIQIKPNHLAVNSPIPVVTGKGEKTVIYHKK